MRVSRLLGDFVRLLLEDDRSLLRLGPDPFRDRLLFWGVRLRDESPMAFIPSRKAPMALDSLGAVAGTNLPPLTFMTRALLLRSISRRLLLEEPLLLTLLLPIPIRLLLEPLLVRDRVEHPVTASMVAIMLRGSFWVAP